MAVNYQNKPFLKESFYTLKNNIVLGEKMRFRAIFDVTNVDGSKLPSCTQDFECESWHEVLDIISEKISNPPYVVFYHMDLRVLKVIERRDKVN